MLLVRGARTVDNSVDMTLINNGYEFPRKLFSTLLYNIEG